MINLEKLEIILKIVGVKEVHKILKEINSR